MAFATSTSAFTTSSPPLTARPNNNNMIRLQSSPAENDMELTRQAIMTHAEQTADNSWVDDSPDHNNEEVDASPPKLIMDIPPSPAAVAETTKKTPPAYTVVTTKKPKSNPAHKEGLFSPLVYAANTLLGKDELNKLRAKIISYHSDIIKSFVDTSDSEFGKTVLKQLFVITDRDQSGYLDKDEVAKALELLGFDWLQEKHVNKIFERADLNEDGEISLEEFMEEAPKTLKTNLVKLAKKNGGEMGLLV